MFAIGATALLWGLIALGVSVEAIVLILPTAFGWTHSIDPGLARTLFSFTLHAIVYFWLLLAYIAYYTMLPRAAGGRLYSDTMGRIARGDAQEGLVGRPRQSPPDSGDSTFGDLDAEHCQLAVNPVRAPEKVGGNHPFDQASNPEGRRGSPAPALVHPRPPSPEPAKPFALPADDRVGSDVNQGSAPAGPQQGQPHPE